MIILVLLHLLCVVFGSERYSDVPGIDGRVHTNFVVEPWKGEDGTFKYAYVLMHYEGTPADDDYVLAAAVTIQSLKSVVTHGFHRAQFTHIMPQTYWYAT